MTPITTPGTDSEETRRHGRHGQCEELLAARPRIPVLILIHQRMPRFSAARAEVAAERDAHGHHWAGRRRVVRCPSSRSGLQTGPGSGEGVEARERWGRHHILRRRPYPARAEQRMRTTASSTLIRGALPPAEVEGRTEREGLARVGVLAVHDAAEAREDVSASRPIATGFLRICRPLLSASVQDNRFASGSPYELVSKP